MVNEDKVLNTLQEILKWIKFSGMKDVKEVLLNNLTDNAKKIIYHHSDGMNNTTYLKRITNVKGNNVIPNLWDKWKNIGIIEKISVKGGERGKKIFNLEDFGIDVPNVMPVSKQEKEEMKSDSLDEESKEDYSNPELNREAENGQEI